MISRAEDILNEAAKCISQRGQYRDNAGGERSMRAAVNAFNELFSHELTETQGWAFMVLLKLSRSSSGKFNMDDYQDAASYCALAGECEEAAKESDLNEKISLTEP